MIKVVVGGATGKLGSLVCSLVTSQKDMCLVGGLVSAGSQHAGEEIAPGVRARGMDRMDDVLSEADVYVDMTSPTAIRENLPSIVRPGLNYVIGTTGIPTEVVADFHSHLREHSSSAVVAPNFSVGVNVFFKTCDMLARSLKNYDVEIVEVHHSQKKDAPSGTARRAADIISAATDVDHIIYGREGTVGARGREIGIHSVRAGDVVGEHTVIFAGKKERIELTHRAHSREAFAEGCIMAVRWVSGRKDGMVHSMEEVLDL